MGQCGILDMSLKVRNKKEFYIDMANIVCNNARCPFRTSVYCKKDFVMLNQLGQCEVWFDKNGGMRMAPFIPPESVYKDATEQELPHDEKTEPEIKNEQEEKITEKEGNENLKKESHEDEYRRIS